MTDYCVQHFRLGSIVRSVRVTETRTGADDVITKLGEQSLLTISGVRRITRCVAHTDDTMCKIVITRCY